jgi:hypothetical protein
MRKLINKEIIETLHKQNLNDKEIAEKLGFTRSGVWYARKRLSLPPNRKPIGTHWNADEINVLKKYYETDDRETLLQLLPRRDWETIKSKARKLGLNRGKYEWLKIERSKGKFNDYEKGLLVGLIEGEGTITISRVGRNKAFRPIVRIANTKQEIIDAVFQLLKKNGFKPKLDRSNKKGLWGVELGGLRKVLPFLSDVSSLLISEQKKKLAKLVIEYSKIRIKTPVPHGYSETPRVFEIIKEIRELNQRGLHSSCQNGRSF